MKKYIVHELEHVWITSDGKRFFEKEKAQKHQDKINKWSFQWMKR